MLFNNTNSVHQWYELPVEYSKLNYIESTGTQYINTGVYPNQYTRVIMDYMSLNATGTGNFYHLFGVYLTSGSNLYRFYCSIRSSTLANVIMISNPISNGSVKEPFTWNNGDRHIVDASPTKYIVDGTDYGVPYTTGTPITSQINLFLTLFGRRNSVSSVDVLGSGRIYHCQITNTNTNEIIRDFVPAQRKSDSVVGLYDTENYQFYTNAGTGTFAYG